MLTFVLLFSLFAVGCGNTEEEVKGFSIYYLNIDKNKLAAMSYDLQSSGDDTQGAVHELLAALSGDSGDVEYKQSIPSGVTYSFSLEEDILTVDFDVAYQSLSVVEDVLCRAAIVKTVTQLDGVNGVLFLVDGASIADQSGNRIGVLTADDFVENPGEQINAIQEASLVLYFSNSTGDGLVKETRNVYYSSNISVEKLVMEQLIDGPTIENSLATIPSETKIINVSVVDGVCFVSLDEAFKNQNYEISENIVIYSIVNTLTELDSVSRVQISINGDTSGKYRDTFDMSTLYERNLDLLSIE